MKKIYSNEEKQSGQISNIKMFQDTSKMKSYECHDCGKAFMYPASVKESQ